MPSDCQLVADYDGGELVQRAVCETQLSCLCVPCSAAILGDDSINCIVEVMGGVTDAKDVVFRAIQVRMSCTLL